MKKNQIKKNSVVLLTASAFFLSLFFLTSCSNNSNEEDLAPKLSAKVVESNMREIFLSEIPAGITPYKVKDNKDLSELINKIENAQAVASSPLMVDSVINNRSFKAPAYYSGSDNYGTFQIYYFVDYDNAHQNNIISVGSGLSGYYPMVEWTVISQGGSWVSQVRLSWWIHGTLGVYVNVGGKYELYSSTKSYGGSIYAVVVN